MALSSAASVLPAGRYTARPLLGTTPAPPALRVGEVDGRIGGWTPVPTLAPFEAYAIDLSRG